VIEQERQSFQRLVTEHAAKIAEGRAKATIEDALKGNESDLDLPEEVQ